jgi:hypothetical protein
MHNQQLIFKSGVKTGGESGLHGPFTKQAVKHVYGPLDSIASMLSLKLGLTETRWVELAI